MHLIAISRLRADAARYPDVSKQVEVWYATVKGANWNNLEDVRDSTIYYKYLLTHAEYDKDKWKNDPYF